MSENKDEISQEAVDSKETMSDDLMQKSEIDNLKEELKKEKEQYLRLFAEFDNYKKRTAKERIDIFKTANSEVVTAILPVLDDFERAVKEIEKSQDDDLFKGVLLIQGKLIEVLRGKGLKSLEVKAGDQFDTDMHEAVTQIPAPTEELKGKIVDVIETGYVLNDKIIRYAKVVIGQ